MIKIAIVADKQRQSILKQFLQLENDIEIRYMTENTADPEIKKAEIIVIDLEPEYVEPFIFAHKNSPASIIVVTETATQGFQMLEKGATEMHLRGPVNSPQYSCKLLARKIRAVSNKEGGLSPRALKSNDLRRGRPDKIIAMGSSTGGTDTVEHILRQLPEDSPPILLVQHMPPIFTRMFAERLHNSCRLSVWEAKDGDVLSQGLVLVAPGDHHMIMAKNNSGLHVRLTKTERVCNQRPSADVLFESVASILGRESHRSIGVILTGMGSDGAQGLLTMRNLGASTIGQDESSCVVYGMPRAAFELGAVQRQLHLNDIATAIMGFVKK